MARVSFYGYDVYNPNNGNTGLTTAGTREFIQIGHKLRFRQYGTMTSIKVYIRRLTNCSEFYFIVWRKKASGLYDRVGITENIISQLAQYTIVTIVFASPITDIQEGDYLGYRIVQTDAGFYQLYADAVAGHNMYYMNNKFV